MAEEHEKKPVVSDKARAYFGPAVIDFVEKNIKFRGPTLLLTQGDCVLPEIDPVEKQYYRARFEDHFSKAGMAGKEPQLCRDASVGITAHNVHIPAQRYGGDEGDPDVIIEEDNKPAFAVTMGKHESPGQVFAKLAEIPVEQAGAIPGTIQDWRAISLMHELSHHEQEHMYHESTVQWIEYDADRGTRQLYKKAIDEGVLSDPRVPHAFAVTRSISFITASPGFTGSHDVAALEIDDTENHFRGDESGHPDFVALSVFKAHKSLYAEVGRKFEEPGDALAAQVQALVTLAMNEKILISPKDAENLKDAQSAYIAGDTKDTSGIQSALDAIKIPDSVQGQYKLQLDYERTRIAVEKGVEICGKNQNPGLLYETARQMYQRGQFDNEPAGKAMMKSFIQGAELYAPEHFSTDNRMTFPPPAEKTAPSADAPQASRTVTQRQQQTAL